jgi:hypothetical protein
MAVNLLPEFVAVCQVEKSSDARISELYHQVAQNSGPFFPVSGGFVPQ